VRCLLLTVISLAIGGGQKSRDAGESRKSAEAVEETILRLERECSNAKVRSDADALQLLAGEYRYRKQWQGTDKRASLATSISSHLPTSRPT